MERPLCPRNTTITALKYVVFHVTPSSLLMPIKAAGFKNKSLVSSESNIIETQNEVQMSLRS